MKNKKLTWLLLPVVLGIWGIIGWKIYTAISGEEENVSLETGNETISSVSPVVPDTYQLLLNYRDPFFEGSPKRIPKPISSSMPVKTNDMKKAEPASATWPAITYSGLVRQPQSGKTVAFLTINGTSSFVNVGDVVSEVHVNKIWADSIDLKFGKESRRVRK